MSSGLSLLVQTSLPWIQVEGLCSHLSTCTYLSESRKELLASHELPAPWLSYSREYHWSWRHYEQGCDSPGDYTDSSLSVSSRDSPWPRIWHWAWWSFWSQWRNPHPASQLPGRRHQSSWWISPQTCREERTIEEGRGNVLQQSLQCILYPGPRLLHRAPPRKPDHWKGWGQISRYSLCRWGYRPRKVSCQDVFQNFHHDNLGLATVTHASSLLDCDRPRQHQGREGPDGKRPQMRRRAVWPPVSSRATVWTAQSSHQSFLWGSEGELVLSLAECYPLRAGTSGTSLYHSDLGTILLGSTSCLARLHSPDIPEPRGPKCALGGSILIDIELGDRSRAYLAQTPLSRYEYLRAAQPFPAMLDIQEEKSYQNLSVYQEHWASRAGYPSVNPSSNFALFIMQIFLYFSRRTFLLRRGSVYDNEITQSNEQKSLHPNESIDLANLTVL